MTYRSAGHAPSSLAALPTLNPQSVQSRVDDYVDRGRWSRSELKEYQARALQSALQRAVASSPFYRERFGSLCESDAPLTDFPVLTKRDLMTHFDQIVSDRQVTREKVEQHIDSSEPGALFLDKYRVFATGGTTGERGLFVYDEAAWRAVVANIVRFQRYIGIDRGARSATVFAPSPVHMSCRFSAEQRALRPGSPALTIAMPLGEIVEALNDYQPDLLATYPSFLRILAQEQQQGRLKISPKLLRSGAETLTSDVRDLVRETWQTHVLSSYSCTEAGFMGSECARAEVIHIAEDLFVFEVVDEENRLVPDGCQGTKLLVTTLTNAALPLVRYELSDLVTMAVEPCPCGLPFWRIASIDGRREEMLELPGSDGSLLRVHALRLRTPLVRTEGIRQFQIVHGKASAEILISLCPDYREGEVRPKLVRTLDGVLGDLGVQRTAVTIRILDDIPRTGIGAKERLVEKR